MTKLFSKIKILFDVNYRPVSKSNFGTSGGFVVFGAYFTGDFDGAREFKAETMEDSGTPLPTLGLDGVE